MTWATEEKCYSQRHACGLVGLDPKTYRYASRRLDDVAVRARLRGLTPNKFAIRSRSDHKENRVQL